MKKIHVLAGVFVSLIAVACGGASSDEVGEDEGALVPASGGGTTTPQCVTGYTSSYSRFCKVGGVTHGSSGNVGIVGQWNASYGAYLILGDPSLATCSKALGVVNVPATQLSENCNAGGA